MTIFADDNEFNEMLTLIERGAFARRADERSQREAEIAERINRILELNSRRLEAVDTDAAKQFVAWVRDQGLALPIRGTTGAAFIIDLLKLDTSMDDLRKAARAVEYVHRVGQWDLDPLPIQRALELAEKAHSLADGGGPDDDGDGQPVVNDNPPSPPANDYEPVPLAAAGA
jgi:hypothetical protein